VTTSRAERSLGERVLVTGAGGFIGSHLIEAALGAGASVRAFVRYNSRNDYGWLEALPAELLEEVDVFRGDLCNPEAVAAALSGCSTVLHLGALVPIPYSYRHPREFVATNREYFNRARQAVMAKITENPAAAAALKVTKSPLLAASSSSVPDLDTSPDRFASR